MRRNHFCYDYKNRQVSVNLVNAIENNTLNANKLILRKAKLDLESQEKRKHAVDKLRYDCKENQISD